MTSDDADRQLAQGHRTVLRNNASAFPYSVFITACFGTVQLVVGGRGMAGIFLFVLGATSAFAVIEGIASHGFQDRFRPDASEVVILGSALSMLSVTAAIGAAWGVSWLLAGTWAWFVAPFLGSATYLVVASAEMAIAHRREEHHESTTKA